MTLQGKSYNTTTKFEWIMLLFCTYKIWLKFCVQCLFSQTLNVIKLKLYTLIRCHQITMQDKFDNSTSD